ncbi:alpha-ketoacid dehydrogenase subunit beta [Actinomadura spongiicola]|uniref:Pyruvate dehydrogenase E1 component subunit beta n=1 Tax=Actinomadura spongiicola TaxID=2303421 RepID=A0A372GNA9_9ACTN|nr:transketolase C-terminal domain-containing protein [Actinomadura spongiicola]RFS86622.1 alpha-ketoacid dehydrogenase subunit beta [Actinomadura spongiicola]
MRVAENLNRALHGLLESDPRVHVLGEDIADPYGGAFKITKGLSTRFPDRVLPTPLSEGAIVGAAAGLALGGEAAIAEIMFGDFAALAFDQLVNFAAKSVSMYGRPVPLPMIVRCPMGGRRGYGPTHSQSLQKHFVGVPGLDLYETSPFHDAGALLPDVLARAVPAVLFEDKVLYAQRMFEDGAVDDLFAFDLVGDGPGVARVYVDDPEVFDCVLIAPGGMAERALGAMRRLLLEQEIVCALLVPARLHPFDVEAPLPTLERAGVVCVAEEGTAGGTWGAEVAHRIHERLWAGLRRPVRLIHSADSVVPTAGHLEERVLVQESTIFEAVVEAVRD